METHDILNSKLIKGFVNNSLLIIGLFIVLSCGIVSFVLFFDSNFIDKVFKFILILACFILIIFIIIFFIVFYSFYCLVELNYKKLYESSYIKYKEILLKMQKVKAASEVCLIAAKTIGSDFEKEWGILQKLVKEMLELSSRLNSLER